MMQYVATSKTELAALATIGAIEQSGGNESSSLASAGAFELAMRQQSTAASSKRQLNKDAQDIKSSEGVATNKVVSKQSDKPGDGVQAESIEASSSTTAADKPTTQRATAATHSLDKSRANEQNPKSQPVDEQTITQVDVPQQNAVDQSQQQALGEETSPEVDDINADSPDEWISLVGQLQSLNVGEANNQVVDLSHLEKWLKHFNKSDAQLADILKNNPQLQQFLHELEKSELDSQGLLLEQLAGKDTLKDTLSLRDRQAMLSSLKHDLAQLQSMQQGGGSTQSIETGEGQTKLNLTPALAAANKTKLADMPAKPPLTQAEQQVLTSQNEGIAELTADVMPTKAPNQNKADENRQTMSAAGLKTATLDGAKTDLLSAAGKQDGTADETLLTNNSVLAAGSTNRTASQDVGQLNQGMAQNAIADGVKQALDDTKSSGLVIGHTGIADESLSDAALLDSTDLQKNVAKILPDKTSLTQITAIDSQAKPAVEVKSKDGLSGQLHTQQGELTKSVEFSAQASQVLQALSELSPSKQEQVIQALAVQIRRSASQQDMADTRALSLQDKTQVLAMAELLNAQSGTQANSKDFVAALKAGLSEFKKQLAAGHHPSFDLKSVVNDALANLSSDNNSARGTGERNVNATALISQLSDLVNHVHDHPDAAKSQGLSHQPKDSGAVLDFAKQQVSQFDKALNLHKPEAQQILAEKVRWMVNSGNLIAEMRLDPAELGSVKVKVAMSSDSAQVSFVVQSHHARDALEAATPKLREMLAEKGIELGQSSVREEHQTKQDSNAKQQGNGSAQGGENTQMLAETESFSAPERNTTKARQGSIDYFV
ncbi:MAG: hypothetical protein GW763_01115 [Paraglaciecola sp.]|nr:hypothetical protein [Paraglaciecola sp.]NCT46593.1 hypothetical protein [Paraglaciecola sp.]